MVYMYDFEVFPNYTLIGFMDRDSEEVLLFEISEWCDDSAELEDFLILTDLALVGYNSIKYDYPLLHYIIEDGLLQMYDPDLFTNLIYNKSQELMRLEFPSVPEWKFKIPQLDLMKVHHLDNKNRSASLKDIAIAIRHPLVEDLPIDPHKRLFKGQDDELRNKVRTYNINDLAITKAFYFKSRKAIDLRKSLTKKYGVNLISASDAKMGSEIFAVKLSRALNINPWELKKMRTERAGGVWLKDCIFPYINFKTKPFQDLLEFMKDRIVYEDAVKGAFKKEVNFKLIKYSFGAGGIHGCIAPGIYQEDENHVIVTSDVTSYYPNLAIRNRFYPQHLTDIFCRVYEDIFNERKLYPKGTPENYGLKIALNASFGKSNDNYSFFKDLKYLLTTTVNGQLLIAMLCERASELGQILMANTDGIEILIHKDKVQEYYDLCAKWERFTRLELEHNMYKKMVIRDVNNYRAIFHNENQEVDEDKEYEKGVFKIDKMLYEDFSMMVVKKALAAYYEKDIPIRKFIREHKDIFDFYIRLKRKSGLKTYIKYVSGNNVNQIELSKTTRYYASTSGGYLYRTNKNDEMSAVRKGQRVTIANNHVPKLIEDYNIDYQFYENECYKIINTVDQGQLNIFK